MKVHYIVYIYEKNGNLPFLAPATIFFVLKMLSAALETRLDENAAEYADYIDAARREYCAPNSVIAQILGGAELTLREGARVRIVPPQPPGGLGLSDAEASQLRWTLAEPLALPRLLDKGALPLRGGA